MCRTWPEAVLCAGYKLDLRPWALPLCADLVDAGWIVVQEKDGVAVLRANLTPTTCARSLPSPTQASGSTSCISERTPTTGERAIAMNTTESQFVKTTRGLRGQARKDGDADES